MAPTKNRSFEGSCQCRSLQYTCSEFPSKILHCHCKDCQKQSGGPYMTYVIVNAASFKWKEDGEEVKMKKLKEVDDVHHKRYHCTRCRSPISRIFDFIEGELQIVETSIDHKDDRMPDGWPTDEEHSHHVMTTEAHQRSNEFRSRLASDSTKVRERYMPEFEEKFDKYNAKKAKEHKRKEKSLLGRLIY